MLLDSWSATMAVHDLRALDALIDRLAELSSYMEGYADLYRDTLMWSLEEAAASDFSEWYLDVGDALEELAGAELPLDLNHLAIEALQAYDDMLYDFRSYASPYDDDHDEVLDYTGAAVYAPSEGELGTAYTSLAFYDVGWADATAAIRADEPQAATGPGPEVSYADIDGDEESDEATLHWAIAHERHLAWVFAETDAGLELLRVLESNGSDLVLTGLAGELTVSASAWDEGAAVTHHTLDLVLTRALDIRVRVESSGGPVTDGIEVVVLTRTGPIYLAPSDEGFVGSVIVPGDARYGDLLTVEVLDKGGAVIAQNRTCVAGPDIALEVFYPGEGDDTPGMELILPVAALTISAAAVAVYLRGRKPGPEA
ncbi:MAG: hypothetical protein AB7S97_04905 [Thermoplasmata archaeon]